MDRTVDILSVVGAIGHAAAAARVLWLSATATAVDVAHMR